MYVNVLNKDKSPFVQGYVVKCSDTLQVDVLFFATSWVSNGYLHDNFQLWELNIHNNISIEE